jgi:hypothetical protein
MLKSSFKLKNVLMLCSMAAGLTALWSCGDDNSGNENSENEIVLQSPANNVNINLAEVQSTEFSWTKVEGVTAYTLKFSPSESGLAETTVKIDAGDNAAYNMSSQEADRILAGNTSLQPGESSDIFWTVTPTVAAPDVKTQVRKFHITRLPAALNPALSVSTESLVFAANPADAQTITVTANIEWQVSIEQTDEWLTANPVAGRDNGSIEITAAENTGAERTAVITVSGTGVESKTVSVTQAAKGSGGKEALLGTWNLKLVEFNSVMTVEDGRKYKTFVTDRLVASLTFNRDGSFTGEVAYGQGANSDKPDDIGGNKTWDYVGDSISCYDNGVVFKYKITVTSSEFVVETDAQDNGMSGKMKATYSREQVTVPPIPDQISNRYTGSASAFYGVWVLSKTEDNFSDANGDNPYWYSISFDPNEEAMKLTVNSDGTFQTIDNIGGETYNGTWTIENGTLITVHRGERQEIQNIEEGSSESTLILSSINNDGTEKSYGRTTWVRK